MKTTVITFLSLNPTSVLGIRMEDYQHIPVGLSPPIVGDEIETPKKLYHLPPTGPQGKLF